MCYIVDVSSYQLCINFFGYLQYFTINLLTTTLCCFLQDYVEEIHTPDPWASTPGSREQPILTPPNHRQSSRTRRTEARHSGYCGSDDENERQARTPSRPRIVKRPINERPPRNAHSHEKQVLYPRAQYISVYAG